MDGEFVAALVLFIYIEKDRAFTLLRIGCPSYFWTFGNITINKGMDKFT